MKNWIKETDNLEFVIKPSQWVNVFWFIVTGVSVFYIHEWAMIPGVIWLGKWLIINCWEYQFHERTITERKGIFSVSTREIHYYRIKSVRVEEPFFYRFVGLSSIDILTSDPLIPVLRLYAIGNTDTIRNYVREMTTYWRKVQGVREYDLR